MQEKINVTIGDYAVAKSPAVIQTIGVGSCVAVCLYDRSAHLGGLAHIMLPDSSGSDSTLNPLRFADKAIEAMVDDLRHNGGKAFIAKILGGAVMFKSISKLNQVGQRNVSAVRAILRELAIPIRAQDVGGDQGRSVWFDTSDGSVVVRTTRGLTRQI